MKLSGKYWGLVLCLLLFTVKQVKAQDGSPDSSNMTLALVMPPAIDGLTDAGVHQMENKIIAILTSNNLASDNKDNAFIIYPKFDINSVEKTSTTMTAVWVAHCTFSLYIKQNSTKVIFATYSKNIDGINTDSKQAAVANAVNQIRPDDSHYSQFIDKAKAKVIEYYKQNCAQFITKAQGEINMRHYETATNILATIPPETGDCYDEAQKQMALIFEKQYGSLDKAVAHYQKEVTVDPGSSIFNKMLGKAKKLVDKRNDENKTPPEIDLITPKATRGQGVEADVTPQKKIYVSGTAKSVSGIASVSVNGQQVPDVTPDGFFQANIDKDATDIIVAATDKKGINASVTFHISGKGEPKLSVDDIAPISDNETFHAIFIANTDYTGAKWPALKTTVPEARALVKMLEDKYNFNPANVDTIFNKSRNEILTTVKNRLDKLTDNDNVVIFYGGHGYFVESTNMAYWVPINADSEFDYISNTDITNLLNGCEARHILVMADACFSGAMRGGLDAPAKYEYKFKSRQLLTSGGTEPVPGKSAYVAMILETMNSNQDKYLSARELYTRIFKGIMDQTNTEPTIRDLKVSGSEGGQFYFRKN